MSTKHAKLALMRMTELDRMRERQIRDYDPVLAGLGRLQSEIEDILLNPRASAMAKSDFVSQLKRKFADLRKQLPGMVSVETQTDKPTDKKKETGTETTAGTEMGVGGDDGGPPDAPAEAPHLPPLEPEEPAPAPIPAPVPGQFAIPLVMAQLPAAKGQAVGQAPIRKPAASIAGEEEDVPSPGSSTYTTTTLAPELAALKGKTKQQRFQEWLQQNHPNKFERGKNGELIIDRGRAEGTDYDALMAAVTNKSGQVASLGGVTRFAKALADIKLPPEFFAEGNVLHGKYRHFLGQAKQGEGLFAVRAQGRKTPPGTTDSIPSKKPNSIPPSRILKLYK